MLKPLMGIVALGIVSATYGSDQSDQDIEIGKKYSLHSNLLDEKRQFWVSLPQSYKHKSSTRYPVLYFLDAENNHFFSTFSSMARQMASDASPVIPELIVVGIVSQNRLRDSSPTKSLVQYGGKEHPSLSVTGGASQFLEFISKELKPEVNRLFKTSGYEIFMGYSFSGLPVVYNLYDSPTSFNAYLAIDPSMWWDDQVLLKQFANFAEKYNAKNRVLFIATSERLGKTYPKENYVKSFINSLHNNPIKGLKVYSKNYGKKENHHSMPVLAFYDGMRAIFDGFMMDEEARFRTADEVKQHFNRVSAALGTRLQPREGLINWFGNERIYNHQFPLAPKEGVKFLKLNTSYYPKSINTWLSLARAYKYLGAEVEALEAYKKALELAPANKEIKAEITALSVNP